MRVLGYHGAPQSVISNMVAVEDQVLDWRYEPYSEVRMGRVLSTYNSAGFRDAEHHIGGNQSVRRILVVGDSVTEGYGVEWKDVFSKVLQDRLGPSHEIITMGMGGLNTPQEIHLLEREGLAYGPDLVVLNFVLNDCDFYARFDEAMRNAVKVDGRIDVLGINIDPRIKLWLRSSALLYFFKNRLENIKGRIWFKEHGNYFSRIWNSAENRKKVLDGFDQLERLKSTNGFDVVVVVWPLITSYKRYAFQEIHQWVTEEARNRGFDVIDLLDAFSKKSYRDLQVSAEDTVHPNALGHAIAAMRFMRWYRMQDAKNAVTR